MSKRAHCFSKTHPVQTVRCFASPPWDDSNNQSSSSFFTMAKPAPIKFQLKRKRLPFNPHLFFRVVQDVDSYPQFVANMPSCYAEPASKQETVGERTVKGKFDAPTQIGFNAISFEYTSRVSYVHPILPVNLHPSSEKLASLRWRVSTETDSSRIFNSLKSTWRIQPDLEKPLNYCLVDYEIEMEFASALYSAVTNQFFNLLVASIDSQFADRCQVITDRGLYKDEYISCDAHGKETV